MRCIVIEALLADGLWFGQFHDALARFLDEIIGKFGSSALQGIFFDAGGVDFPQGSVNVGILYILSESVHLLLIIP